MAKNPDPTKDPEFQKVVQTFLRTPPKPHKKASVKGKNRLSKKASKPAKAD